MKVRRRRTFSREYKLEAVRLIQEEGRRVTDVARDLGVDHSMLRRWVEQFTSDTDQAFPGKGHVRADEEELQRLRRELADAREERDILKKALAIFSKGPK
jgi:transposase